VGSMRGLLLEVPIIMGSTRDSSSEVFAIVKSDRVETLMDGDRETGATGDAVVGIVYVSVVMIDSDGGV